MIKTLISILFLPIAGLSQNIDTLKIVSSNKMLSGKNTVSTIELFESPSDSSVLFTVYQDTIAKNFKSYYEFASPDKLTFWPADSIRVAFEKYLIESHEVSSKNQLLAIFKNSSNKAITLDTYGGEVSMIQEALNEKGDWQPVEYYSYGDCAFGHHILLIKKGEQIRILTTRYSGDFATKLRLKLLTKSGTFFSEEFEGQVNKSQFRKPHFKRKLRDNYSFLNE